MAGRKERLIHLLLRESIGGETPPDLSRDIMDAIDGRGAPVYAPAPPRAFSGWMAVAAAVALFAALTVAVSAWMLNRETDSLPTALEPDSAPAPHEHQARPDGPPEAKSPVPEPAPPYETPQTEPPPPVHGPKPEDTPPPEPESKPEVTPDDTVESPETPEPEPKEPDDTVETPPQPTPDRPPTEADTPQPPPALGTVLYVEDRGKLTYRHSDDEKWQDWQPGSAVVSGMKFKVRRTAGIELQDGARLYFDGEIALLGDEDSLDVTIADSGVYFDVYGSKRDFTVRRNEAVLTFRDAEVLAERSGLRLQVTCLGGEVTVGDVTLPAGWSASLSDKGFSRRKFEGSRARGNALVAGMDNAFVLMREELNEDAAPRVYHGDWQDGIVKGSGKEMAFGIDLSEHVEVKERGFVRMRIRVHGSPDGLSIGFGSTEESGWRYFQSHHKRVPNDEWTILRVPLAELQDDGDDVSTWPGAKLRKFQIVLWTKTNSHVEVDWFEIGIDPEWNLKENK